LESCARGWSWADQVRVSVDVELGELLSSTLLGVREDPAEAGRAGRLTWMPDIAWPSGRRSLAAAWSTPAGLRSRNRLQREFLHAGVPARGKIRVIQNRRAQRFDRL
jgi:hypothetical protein